MTFPKRVTAMLVATFGGSIRSEVENARTKRLLEKMQSPLDENLLPKSPGETEPISMSSKLARTTGRVDGSKNAVEIPAHNDPTSFEEATSRLHRSNEAYRGGSIPADEEERIAKNVVHSEEQRFKGRRRRVTLTRVAWLGLSLAFSSGIYASYELTAREIAKTQFEQGLDSSARERTRWLRQLTRNQEIEQVVSSCQSTGLGSSDITCRLDGYLNQRRLLGGSEVRSASGFVRIHTNNYWFDHTLHGDFFAHSWWNQEEVPVWDRGADGLTYRRAETPQEVLEDFSLHLDYGMYRWVGPQITPDGTIIPTIIVDDYTLQAEYCAKVSPEEVTSDPRFLRGSALTLGMMVLGLAAALIKRRKWEEIKDKTSKKANGLLDKLTSPIARQAVEGFMVRVNGFEEPNQRQAEEREKETVPAVAPTPFAELNCRKMMKDR